jgi:outer membrane protein
MRPFDVGRPEAGLREMRRATFVGVSEMSRMTAKLLLAIFLFLSSSILVHSAQEPSGADDLLTLDQAVKLAVDNNRPLRFSFLQIQKSRESVAETRTQQFPVFKTYLFASELLTPLDFTFSKGVLGSFPATGPIPATDTQLYKIRLAIHAQQLAVDYSDQEYRAQREQLVRDVKQAYYAVLQAESSLTYTQTSVNSYLELSRFTDDQLAQKTVLKSASLEVKARLAKEQYNLIELNNTLASRKEQLNLLLGRDIRTSFHTQPVPEPSAFEMDLKAAQDRALSNRPELREAQINVDRAEFDRRLAKAQYIPDFGVALHYISPFNVNFVPQNIAAFGFELNWEPFDWGRKRHEVEQKRLTVDQMRLQANETQSKILLDLDTRFRDLQQARSLVSVAAAGLDAEKEKARELTDEFRQQSVLLKDVLQQQSIVASSEDEYQQALLSFWDKRAEFEKTIGEDGTP